MAQREHEGERMTYDKRTRDLVYASCCLNQAEEALNWAGHAVSRLGLPEDEEAIKEMWERIYNIRHKVQDELGDYAVEGLESERIG